LGRRGAAVGLALLVVVMALGVDMNRPEYGRITEHAAQPSRFPTIPAEHAHVRQLLENAMRYLAPESGTTDQVSGYPVEGWNHDPEKGLCLRCFTQLTAIGEWIEALANVVAGYAETPYLSREQALSRLTLAVKSLREDQKDPDVSAKGLLGNFLNLAGGKRQGPLLSQVDKKRFLDAFGPETGDAVWQSLQAKGWIVPMSNGREAAIRRGPQYGAAFFDGALAPYADEATKTKILEILDDRVVAAVFGDNANLSTSLAKAIGALLAPNLKDDPKIEALRRDLDQFLENQREGYAHLYDPKAGLFAFGWDATRDRLLGWEDGEGNWQIGHMDYLVNEFRGPATFVVVRYGLPVNAIRNLGFKMKPYQIKDGKYTYVLAPWEGSAFQALGLGLSMMELNSPGWRATLKNIVDIEIDYAARKRLPGFLSESYTGEGSQYTGNVGIPEIAVSEAPRITDVASLYTLGVAYTVSPEKIEQFLAVNWPTISRLLTDHGPWEGFNMAKQEPVEIQTTAHTLSLILGFLGTGSEHMRRYLDFKGLSHRLEETCRPGENFDFLSDQTQVFAWADKGAALDSSREKAAFHVKGDRVHQVGMAFVHPRSEGVNLSNGLLRMRYRSTQPIDRAVVALKPAASAPNETPKIPNELFARFTNTGGREEDIEVPLPAIPGLTGIKEVVITYHPATNTGPVDLSITGLAFTPFSE
jgi:hypothetical protein